MMPKILAVAEQRDGKLRTVSGEVVSAARNIADALGAEVHAALLGPPAVLEAAPQLGRFGASSIHVGTHDAFDQYSPDGFAATLAELIRAGDYHTVLFAASAAGKDLAPRIAARLNLPLASDATALAVESGELIITRPILAGRAFARVSLDSSPRLVSVRPNVFLPAERPVTANIANVAISGTPDQWKVVVHDTTAAAAGRLDVAEAPIIVSGGRGMKGPENWHLLEALRDAIGAEAALGASRAVVDQGWRPHSEQVGQTGKTVSPKLYFAVAISGAMQHLAGMRSAGTIVAINKDADAPIFKVADYGLVGDVTEILPRLSEEIRKARGT
jgi:electron transfer flavoprotein alpha subunit